MDLQHKVTVPAIRQGTWLAAAILVSSLTAFAQPKGFNYDESKVPPHALPDPLRMEDGRFVSSREQWEKERRPEVLQLFRDHVYGNSPKAPDACHFQVFDRAEGVLGGVADRLQVRIRFAAPLDSPGMDLLVYLPTGKSNVPAFLGLNFQGNHTVHADPAIRVTESWVRNNSSQGIQDNKTREDLRGAAARRWPVEEIVKRGYAVATIYYGDIDPDFHDGYLNGLHPLFGTPEQRTPASWGSIGAWSWGLSRALDYFQIDNRVNAGKVAVIGHSRLGKTSLWAGAEDPRFAFVISNDSGCGGAAISRRRFGETVERINTSFPHWFCDRFKEYNGNEDALPVDQHMLIALMAPRPVYIASAEDDQWADPKGEFLSGLHAGDVYRLFQLKGVGVQEQPPVNHPVGGFIGYHVRTGKHDVTLYDWQQYMNFADRHWGTP